MMEVYLIHQHTYSYEIVNDSVFYCFSNKNDTTSIELYNVKQIEKTYQFPFLFTANLMSRTDSMITVIGYFLHTEDHVYYRFDSLLHLIDSTIIPIQKFLK